MIFGMMLKNYKNYNGLYYIPVFQKDKFIAYIGDNGVGKSSILEALGTYFNNYEWNATKGASKTGENTPIILLLHILDSAKVDNIVENLFPKTKDDYIDKIRKISDSFKTNSVKLASSSDEAKKLLDDLARYSNQYENRYIFISGIEYNNSNITFGSFKSHIIQLFSENDPIEKDFNFLNTIAYEYYSYIHLPVEDSVEELTKIENFEMQLLIGKNLKDAIASIIGQDTVSTINNKLSKFIHENIEAKLTSYKYQDEHREKRQKNVTIKEFTNVIIENFFKSKILHRKEMGGLIPIYHLSSGEKRQALIKLSTTLIESQKEMEKELILAIDEPESSLNSSKIYSQFEDLIRASKNAHIAITTHWYGFLPIATNGTAHYLSKVPRKTKQGNEQIQINFCSLDLFNYKEQMQLMRKENKSPLPFDIELKSNNDLVHSIITSMRADEPYNWIICEGSSDKIYLEFYLKQLIQNKNLRIIPVGGSSYVVKLYEKLVLALSDSERDIKGKVLCICDTDNEIVPLKLTNLNINNFLLQRLQIKESKSCLVEYNPVKDHNICDIEDCLNGETFVKTICQFDDIEIQNIIEQERNNFTEFIDNSHSYMHLRPGDKELIKNFFKKSSTIKVEFANKYIENIEEDRIVPNFVNEIINKFES